MLYNSLMNTRSITEKLLGIFGTQARIAEVAKVSQPFVSKVLSEPDRFFAPASCVALERESKKAITRPELRPNDWQDIWPELADRRRCAERRKRKRRQDDEK